jgi:hypothetical protein
MLKSGKPLISFLVGKVAEQQVSGVLAELRTIRLLGLRSANESCQGLESRTLMSKNGNGPCSKPSG